MTKLTDIENRLFLIKAMRNLSFRQRKLIVLRYWHDWTYEKIGARYDLTRERTRQIIVRSIQKMRFSEAGTEIGAPDVFLNNRLENIRRRK